MCIAYFSGGHAVFCGPDQASTDHSTDHMWLLPLYVLPTHLVSPVILSLGGPSVSHLLYLLFSLLA